MNRPRPFAFAVLIVVVMSSSSSGADAVAAKWHTQDVTLAAGLPVITELPNGDCRLDLDGYSVSCSPGEPALPQKGVNILVHSDVDWSTLELEIVDLDSQVVPGCYRIAPAPPAVMKFMEAGQRRERYAWGPGKRIADGRSVDVYESDSEWPGAPVTLLPYATQRTRQFARILFRPVQYNPVRHSIRLVVSARVRLRYQRRADVRLAVEDRARGFAAVLSHLESGESKRISHAMESAVPSSGRDDTFNYVIITTEYIATNSTELDNYIAHKAAQGYSILVKTVESIEVEYTRTLRPDLFESTDERADRIKAFLRDKYLEYGIEYALLIGDPDPDDVFDSFDSVGDVPMKFCYPDYGINPYHAPTDSFYTDLTGQWDRDGDGIYGEWNGDRGAGGVDLAGVEVIVTRIPYYSADLTQLDSVFRKIMDYEAIGVDESWKHRCFMPNPIDWSDDFGREGNTSPITMAEWIKENVLIPEAFEYYRIYEHNYDYPPHNVDPRPEQIPEGLGYTCFTRYDSTHYFRAGVNVSSDAIGDYTITAMTDSSDITAWSAWNFSPDSFVQFKTVDSGDAGAAYAAYRIVIRSDSVDSLPQQFTIRMAYNAHFSDAFTVVTETDAAAHAVQRGGYWELEYVAPESLSTVGGKRYLRLTYTGSTDQSHVQINEFLGYTEEAQSIQSYVIPEWLNGYGVVYYNTHGWPQGASEIITSGECSLLDDMHPSFVFSKACSTASPEQSDNLCSQLVQEGGIASCGATRISYGWGDTGYQLFLPKLINENKSFGVVICETRADMETAGWYGWAGLYFDAMKFNVYGDPTVHLLSRLDTDDDGLPDDWELDHFGDLSHHGGQDEEPDGLTNAEEFEHGTDPLDEDSDDDGLTDGAEVLTHSTDPLDDDTDDDGLEDGAEIAAGTDPRDTDSDDDLMPDGWEVDVGLNPLVDDADEDPDRDGFTNLEECVGASDPMAPWSIPPPRGRALDFDGEDDFVDLGDVAIAGPHLCVEVWVKPRATGSARILEKLQDYGIQLTGENQIRFVTKHGYTWDLLDGVATLEPDEWAHVACVLDGSQKTIHINGLLDTQKSYHHDVQVTANTLIVGANSPGGGQGYIDAIIDDVRVWRVARSEADIQAAMQAGLSGSEPGLAGYWNFDEGSGQRVADLAGDHDGRLGASIEPDSADPTWVESPVGLDPAWGDGPGIGDVLHPSAVSCDSTAVVTAFISDEDYGDDGVASATLYYGYAWPFNFVAVAGVGPEGEGSGTWRFPVGVQGPEHEGETLSFYIRADDVSGNPSFDSRDGALYTIAVRRPGDWDGDGDADLVDYAAFADCLLGPAVPGSGPDCAVFDRDADSDVDLFDFAAFAESFTE